MAEDPESGRREFFPARGSEIEVTEVVAAGKGLRVKDPKMASIRNIGSGAVVVGRYPGKTQVKVRNFIWIFTANSVCKISTRLCNQQYNFSFSLLHV